MSKSKSPKPTRVLVVEDLKKLREECVRQVHAKWEPETEAVASRQEALALVNGGWRPDLVIMDRGILEVKGGEVASSFAGDDLYKQLWRKGIPIAVVSADPVPELELYVTRPPLAFATKPYNRLLMTIIEDAWEERGTKKSDS